MKKHILGAAIFGFIFASIAIAFTFLDALPIPQIEEIEIKNESKPKILDYRKTSCFRQKEEVVVSEVQSTQFDLDSGVLTSKVKLKWNSTEEAPKVVYAKVHLFTIENDEEGLFDGNHIFINPFQNNKETIVTIRYKVKYDVPIDMRKNLYAFVEFSQNENFANNLKAKEDVSKAQQVLFIHGGSSIIEK